MSASIKVQIIGAPVVCKDGVGVKDSWREVAAWTAGKLRLRFGEAVEVSYYDLFDVNCPAMPADAKLPVVFVEGEVLSSGEIISMPAIRRKIEGLVQKRSA
jgi:hypothetical protein